MVQRVNLGAETVEFVRQRMTELIGEDPQNIKKVKFDMKEVKEQIFRLFYDYQVVRNWPHVAANTAEVLGYDHRSINKMLKNRSRSTNRN